MVERFASARPAAPGFSAGTDLWRDRNEREDEVSGMIRCALLLAVGLLLSSCASWNYCRGYGPCTGKAIASPYDQADLYQDAQGYPLPGWEQMKYGPESDNDQ